MNRKIPDHYTTDEIRRKFGWSHQQVWATAQREGWMKTKVGNGNLYQATHIDDFSAHRTRTKLAKELGIWRGASLYRDQDYDIECPICREFAIERPPTEDEILSESWQSGEYSTEWICVNGHSERKEDDS